MFDELNAKLDNLKQARLTVWQLFKDNMNELNSNLGQASIESIEHYWPEQKARKGWELLELIESRARAWKRKQAGLLPLSEDEDVGDQSDKTQLLKQITGGFEEIEKSLERIENKERVKEEKGSEPFRPISKNLTQGPCNKVPKDILKAKARQNYYRLA
ncbi:hypothetical protein BY996DRAFT_6582187 [Phakopsora pachyrhizi]|nr:hypothetical protein BY996DRAFT_6582187 [Phakopsora pachyrhizi]